MKKFLYLPFLLTFILIDVVCDNYIFRAFDSQKTGKEISLFLLISILQMLFAPIQTGLSDFYSRKKVLIVSLFAAFLALSIIFIYFFTSAQSGSFKAGQFFPLLVVAGILKGCFGNTVPVAWVAISDAPSKDYRFSFGLSTAAFAVGYLILVAFNNNKWFTVPQANLIIVLSVMILFFLCLFYFEDAEKTQEPLKDNELYKMTKSPSVWQIFFYEISQIQKTLKDRFYRYSLLAFFFWEISLYTILLLAIDFDVPKFDAVSAGMMIAYLIGVLLLKVLRKVSDSIIIRQGYFIALVSVAPIIVFLLFTRNINPMILVLGYSLHTLANAFLCSTLFSIFAKRVSSHQLGKMYGLISSTDTAALGISTLIVVVAKQTDSVLEIVTLTSFTAILLSYLPYKVMKKYGV